MEEPPASNETRVSDDGGSPVSSSTVEVNLEHAMTTSEQATGQSRKARKVKRYIHCSDGVYEEFSSDEEGVYPVSASDSLVDPRSMNWMPWIAHVSSKALAACDYVGETLADFLGITSPKYKYEIEEAKRMQEEEKAEKKASDLEMAGWRNPSQSSDAEPKVQSPQSSIPVSVLLKVVPSQSNGPHVD